MKPLELLQECLSGRECFGGHMDTIRLALATLASVQEQAAHEQDAYITHVQERAARIIADMERK